MRVVATPPREILPENNAGLMPDAIDALGSHERYRVYRIIGMEKHLMPDGSFELSEDAMNFSELEIPSS